MKFFSEKLIDFGNSIFCVMSVLWLFFIVRYLAFETEGFDKLAVLLALFSLVILFLVFFFRKKFLKLVKEGYKLLNDHKLVVFILMILFQLFLVACAPTKAIADANAVFQLAIGSKEVTPHYISVNPNNFALVVLFKIVHKVVSVNNLIMAMAIVNIILLDAAICLLYYLTKTILGKAQGDVLFLLSVLLLGLSPQVLNTYSDCVAFFMVVISIFFAYKLIKSHTPMAFVTYGVLTGVSIMLSYQFRPPTMVFVIAFLFTAILFYYMKKLPAISKKSVIKMVIVLVSFAVGWVGFSTYAKNQKFVEYDMNQSRTLLYYVNLGLTYSGAEHADLPEDVVVAVGDERNKSVMRDIERRMDEYTYVTFIKHLFYKYQRNVSEGMMGWNTEVVLQEENVQRETIFAKITNSKIGGLVRSIIFARGSHFPGYNLYMQIVWFVCVLGVLLHTVIFTKRDFFTISMEIAIFGGMLFLMIFEGGRSRYLIQFLPAIIVISSVGLVSFSDKLKGSSFKNNEQQEIKG